MNRLLVLFLPGDVFANRIPDPVLQQVEGFQDGIVSANDCFRSVSRYFDRIARPEQLLAALPRAMATLVDPAECGPITLALCQGRADRDQRLSRGILPAPSVGHASPAARCARAGACRGPASLRQDAPCRRRRRGPLLRNLRRTRRLRRAEIAVVGDVRTTIGELDAAPGDLDFALPSERSKADWSRAADAATRAPGNNALPSDAQVIGAVQRTIGEDGMIVCAAGGLPGELRKLWRSPRRGDYHLEWLFLHGLRNRRRSRRQDGAARRRGRGHPRRRLVHDDELGARDQRHAGPEADRRGARQPRLRLYRSAAARHRRRELQQPARHRPAPGALRHRFRRPCRLDRGDRDPCGRYRGARRRHDRCRNRLSLLRHRHRHRPRVEHRGRRPLAGRRGAEVASARAAYDAARADDPLRNQPHRAVERRRPEPRGRHPARSMPE